jgi:hypothetical protein
MHISVLRNDELPVPVPMTKVEKKFLTLGSENTFFTNTKSTVLVPVILLEIN